MAQLIGLGHCVMDQLMLLSNYPVAGSKSTALRRADCGGGPVPNALVAASRLGCSCTFAGQLGDDRLGQEILDSLRRENIDLEPCRILAGHTSPLASIWVEQQGGRRTIVLDRGDLPPMTETDLPELDLGEGDLLLLDAKDPVAHHAASLAHSRGAKVLLDLGGTRPGIMQLLPLADIVIASKAFLLAEFPDCELFSGAQLICEQGPEFCAITMGAGGLVYAQKGEASQWFPSWPETGTSVDGTGAGDAFHGVFAWATLQGFEIRDCLKAASIAGGMVCRQLGGRAGLPDLQQIRAAMEAWSV